MPKPTPVPTSLIEFVKRFPGLTASGISQLMGKRSDWASGALNKMATAGRLERRQQKGMTKDAAWRYYPVGHKDGSCPACKKAREEIRRLKDENQELRNLVAE